MLRSIGYCTYLNYARLYVFDHTNPKKAHEKIESEYKSKIFQVGVSPILNVQSIKRSLNPSVLVLKHTFEMSTYLETSVLIYVGRRLFSKFITRTEFAIQ